MKLLLLFLLSLSPFSAWRCGTEAGNPDDTDTAYRDENGIMQLNLSETIESGVSASVSAVDLSVNGLAGGGTSLTSGTVESTPYCTSRGAPISQTASENTEESSGVKYMSDQNKNYAAGYFYCLLRQDTNSNESVPGALIRAKIWPCIAGESLKFDGKQKSVTVTSLDSLTACIGSERVASLKSKNIKSIQSTYTATEVNTGVYADWDGVVTFENKFDGVLVSTEKVLIKKSDFVEAYADLTIDSDSKAEAFVFYFNRATKNIYYELWAPNRGAESGSTIQNSYHIRALAEGEVASKKFTKLSRYRAIRGNSYFPNNKNNSNYLSIDGNASDGFRVSQYYCSGNSGCSDLSNASFWRSIHRENNCYGGTNCGAGFTFNANALQFLLDENAKTGVIGAEQWFNTLALPKADMSFSESR